MRAFICVLYFTCSHSEFINISVERGPSAARLSLGKDMWAFTENYRGTVFGGSPGALEVPGSLILEKSFGCVSKNYLFPLLGFHNFIMTIDGEYSCETVSTNAQVESLHFICLSFSTMFNLSSNRWRVIGRDLPTCIATYSPGMKQPSFLFS